MIDLHTHILPAIDDGPPTLPASVMLADAAVDAGIETVAATPHLRADHPFVRPDELLQRCESLGQALSDCAIPLRVVPAAEVDIVWATGAEDEELRLASYGQAGVYLLLETPYGPLSDRFEDLIFNVLVAKGLRVVLAHPERNPTFQDNPGRLRQLVRREVLLQVTAPALISAARRSRSRRLATALIEDRLAHVLASDAHRAEPPRGPSLDQAVEAAARIAPARARWMVTDAPAAILAGERLPAPPREIRRSRLGRRNAKTRRR